MKDLKEIRTSIDALDSKIAALLAERLKLADEVADAKRSERRPVGDAVREREILTRLSSEVGAGCGREIRTVYSTLFGVSKARQRHQLMGEVPLVKEIRAAEKSGGPNLGLALVASCGTEGSYAQQATSQMFEVPTILYFNSFEKVFEAVESGACPYGVLPVENSSAGSVAAVYDLMQKHRFHIVRACKLRIRHVLMGVPGAKLDGLTEISSHPHALSQCGNFLKGLSGVRAIPAINTAVAARELAQSGRLDRGVIASRACADLYGLSVLSEDVSDASDNYTRFICIARDLALSSRANKLSLMLSLPHRPGSLCEVISKFSAIGVNLTKLESRPVAGSPFEFRFVFDFDATATSPDTQALLAELSTDPEIDHFAFLGAYEES